MTRSGLPLLLVPLAVFSLVWGMGGALISLGISRWIAKRAMGVHLVDGRTGNPDLDWLHNTVGHLTQQANLPMPEVGVYDSPEVNAFATGPSKSRSLVAVSTGLFRSMRHEEIEGVLGHELAHIGNGDMVTMTLLQGVINAFVMFFARAIAFAMRGNDNRNSQFVTWMVVIVLEIGLGILGSLVTAWFSRQREFRADAGAASLMGSAVPMQNALRRLGNLHTEPLPQNMAASGISGGKGGVMALSDIHQNTLSRSRPSRYWP